jgi:hypothetical protein
VWTRIIDEARRVALIRFALGLIAELAVVHQSNRLKRILARLDKAAEKVGDASAGACGFESKS